MDIAYVPSAITTQHDGVEITYIEDSDKWTFELRGRQRFAVSLKEAREAIDKQPKAKRSFEPFEVWKVEWASQGTYTPCTLTSFDSDGKHAWVRGITRWGRVDEGARVKESLAVLLMPNNHNKKLLAALTENAKAEAALDDAAKALREKFEHPSPDSIPDDALTTTAQVKGETK